MTPDSDDAKLLTASAYISGTFTVAMMDVITYQDRLWIVPTWRRNDENGWSQPVHMIPLDAFRYEDMRERPDWKEDYYINEPVPDFFFRDEAIDPDSVEGDVAEELGAMYLPSDPSLRRIVKRGMS